MCGVCSSDWLAGALWVDTDDISETRGRVVACPLRGRLVVGARPRHGRNKGIICNTCLYCTLDGTRAEIVVIG